MLLLQAAELENRAAEFKKLAADARTANVVSEIARLAGPDAAQVDLLRGALTIARLDEEDLDVEAYVSTVQRMAGDIQAKYGDDVTEAQKLAMLNEYLFEENGYHGSRTDYYHRANSYLSRVIDDREGLPITLSVLYMELGRRLGLTLEGVGLPGHFVVRRLSADGSATLIDVFDGGKILSREAAERKILAMTGEPPRPDHFEAATARQILQRILLNLIGIAQDPKKGVDREALIRYESAMLAIDPTLARDLGLSAVCRWETGRVAAAVADLQILIDAKPDGLDVAELKKMQEYFRASKPAVRP
jgi:regulator of sirC expression with transglutaminase-like and TPR domain